MKASLIFFTVVTVLCIGGAALGAIIKDPSMTAFYGFLGVFNYLTVIEMRKNDAH